eukprot:6181395-Pleurochrysis_carterae.AAC.1
MSDMCASHLGEKVVDGNGSKMRYLRESGRLEQEASKLFASTALGFEADDSMPMQMHESRETSADPSKKRGRVRTVVCGLHAPQVVRLRARAAHAAAKSRRDGQALLRM